MIKILTLFCGLILKRVHCCVEITGIGDGVDDLYTLDYIKNNNWPLNNAYRAFYPALISGNFPIHETPIGIRAATYFSIAYYNVLSYYDEIAIEFWARNNIINERRRCIPNNNDNTPEEIELFEYHRSIAFGYILSRIITYYFPLNDNVSISIMNSFGLDRDICNNNNNNNNININCSDISTPWGIANIVFKEVTSFSNTDGWNYDGSLSRPYNLIEFDDFRNQYYLNSKIRNGRYEPVNTPWRLINKKRWQPLVETDTLGFIYRQEHVTPHIGYTGKSFIYNNSEFCLNSKIFQNNNENWPNYDYNIEMELVLNRTGELDDLKKLLIERFDSKGILNRLRGNYIRNGLGYISDSIYFAASSVVNDVSLYEGILAVWKEKVDFDRVRPTSIIHDQLGGTTITSYAGTTRDGLSYGTQTFDAIGWNPFIRTMPHAEYPSGSSCVCSSWSEAFINWFNTDSWNNTLPNGFTLRFPAFSSQNEPLSTPSQTVSLTLNSFSQVSDICGESRLWGGMHFTKSVKSGRILCKNIGIKVSNIVKNLLYGYNDAYTDYKPDINDNNIYERDCYPKYNTPDSNNISPIDLKCNNSPCNENESDNCRVYNNFCSQCNNGYFKFSKDYKCVNCQEFFGDECLFCTDFNGCQQCQSGYIRQQITDAETGLKYYYCQQV